jgi:aspartate carbamoyltransferase catalytic subunit
MTQRHIIESKQFDIAFLTTIFNLVRSIECLRKKKSGRHHLKQMLAGDELINFFYAESTRTRISFNLAAKRLGMDVCETTNAEMFSSVAKGETLEDTIRVLCGYEPDVIVLRHKLEHAAQTAAHISDHFGYKTKIINGGDGPGQHPTQALTDVYTIKKILGHLDALHVVVVGDLLYGRTTHSLVFLLSKFKDVRFTFVSPAQLSMKKGIIDHLNEYHVPWAATDDLSGYVADADVVYMTRTQWERLPDVDRSELEALSAKCQLTLALAQVMKRDSIILHPLPRLTEIERTVDELPQAAYFEQAANGVLVRMALLLYVLEMENAL